MELFEAWRNRNQKQTDQNIICFVDENMLIHRKIAHYLSVSVPNDWNILSLYEPEKQMEQHTEKTNHYKIDGMSNCKAYFIKKQFLEKVEILETNGVNRLDALNQSLRSSDGKEKVCYVFRVPLVYPVNQEQEQDQDQDTMTYYEYYDEKNLWISLIEECQKTIQNNISIRHGMGNLSRFNCIKQLVHIFDNKLGFSPWIVNELITMSTISTLSNDQNIEQIEDMMKNKSLIFGSIPHNDYFDKSIINKFFDQCVYKELPMCVVIPSFNNELYYEKNLTSVIKQKYSNFRVIYIDDQSMDRTFEYVKDFLISNNQMNRAEILKQSKHGAQCCGRFIGYMMTDDDEIVCNLDGDDFFYDRDDVHKYNALKYVESKYLKGMWSTYGCFYKSSGPQWMETTQIYPKEVVEQKLYRTHKFLCKHLRTGYAGLYKNIDLDDLMGPDGKFLHMCTDIAVQYPVCEMAGKLHGNVLVPTYIYNQDNSLMYNNSWYNLEKKDNESNKIYFNSAVEKIKTRKPYETLNTYMTSHCINLWERENQIDIVMLNLGPRDIQYYLSKINHEYMKAIKYKIHMIQHLDQYAEQDNKSNLVLFIDVDSTRIGSNLNPEKIIKWLGLKGYVLVDDQIDVTNGSYCTDEGSGYDIIVTKTNDTVNTDSKSGYYTRDKFESMIIRNDLPTDTYQIIARPKERISLIMALYGIKKEWLEVAIQSIIEQKNDSWNLLICDDGTTDLKYKRQIVRYLHDMKNKYGNRIRMIENQKNVGLAGTNLNLVGHTETKYIGSLDPDDALTDLAVNQILDQYLKDQDVDFVYSNFYYCDQDLVIKSNGYAKPLNQGSGNLVIYENCVSAFRTYKKSSYHHTLGYDPSFRSAEDKDIILKFEESGAKFVMVQEHLYKYRYNPGSLARTSDGSEAFNNHKTLQYCRNAVRQSHYRRYQNEKNICEKPIDEIFIKYGMKNIPMTSYEKYFNEYFDMVYCINLQSRDDKLEEMKIKMHLAGIKKVKFMRFVLARDYQPLIDVHHSVMANGPRTTYEKKENKKVIQSIGELGCSESHMYCVKDALKNGFKRILIVEDDVYFHKHFLIKFKEYMDQVPVDWQFLMLGASQWSWWGNAPFIKKNLFHPTRASMGTFALALNIQNVPVPNHDLIHQLIDNLSMYDAPADLGGYSRSIVRVNANENIHSTIFLREKRYPITHCHVFYPNLIIADTTDSTLRDGDSDAKYLSRCKSMDWQIDDMMRISKNCPNVKKYLDLIQCDSMVDVWVNDYDSIYPDTQVDPQGQYIELPVDGDLPYRVHCALMDSRNSKILIKGDILGSDFIYYMDRIKHFPGIIFSQ
jgi:glycosyltransferase involved in cell wall biosynthesis